ncbi:MAG: hypothetical protein ACFFAS_10450 [Promethearchaeota archaeon]
MDGSEIALVGGLDTYSDHFTSNMTSFNDTEDEKEDIICLEYNYHESSGYNISVLGYYLNGTKIEERLLDTDVNPNYYEHDRFPYLELFQYGNDFHLLYVDRETVRLINLTDVAR